MYDVVIAGAGVIGAFIARELSRYELKVCLLEKGNDVASGSSKANSGIVHAGFDCTPGTLKAMLNVRGAGMMEEVTEQLDVPYRRTGSLVVGFTESDRAVLEDLLQKGMKNGVEGLRIIGYEELHRMEPRLSPEASIALYAPSAGIVCPYELTAAAVENAVMNGVELRRNAEVTAVRFNRDRVNRDHFHEGTFEVEAGGETLESRYFINAAGVYSGAVARMAGDDDVVIIPRKGEYLLLDKNVGSLVNTVVFQCPTALGKGILVTPTVDGNLMIGPDALDIDDREDLTTTSAGYERVLQGARRAVPSIDPGKAVTSFSGLRARPAGGDFIIRPSFWNEKLIHVAGIESPGLSCAPAIGQYVAEILKLQNRQMNERADFQPCRAKVIRFREMAGEELDALLKKDPSYGRLVCRCEKVTEGEIVDAIRRPGGAQDLDALKRRTRAGMGRCQGGFCSPRLVELLSRELGIPYDEVTKKGGDSWLLAGRTK